MSSARPLERAVEDQHAGIDVELLPVGAEARAHRAQPALRLQRAGRVGEHADLPGDAAVEAEAAQRQALAEVEAHVEVDR